MHVATVKSLLRSFIWNGGDTEIFVKLSLCEIKYMWAAEMKLKTRSHATYWDMMSANTPFPPSSSICCQFMPDF